MLSNVLIAAAILITTTIFHELGHLLYFRFGLQRKVNLFVKTKPLIIEVGCWTDYFDLTNMQRSWLYFSGVIAGFFAFAIGRMFVGYFYMAIIVLIYAVGCKDDIQNLIQASKSVNVA